MKSSLDGSTVLHLLQNSRRRALLKVLRKVGGRSSLREVVRKIAEVEGVSARGLIESIRVSVLQTHIPKMRRAGIIEYDRATDKVYLLELPPKFRYYLEVVEGKDISWSLYYLVLSIFGVVAMVLGNLLALVLASIFVVAALIHTSQMYGLCNESLRRCKRTLRKYINPHSNSTMKKREE